MEKPGLWAEGLTALKPDGYNEGELHTRKGVGTLARVIIEEGESFESALKRFNKQIQADKLLSELRRRRYYEPPSVIRKRKKAAKLRKSRRTTLKALRAAGLL